MCSNYRPATTKALSHFPVEAPLDLVNGKDAYPGSDAPIILPEEHDGFRCVLGTFGLLPTWAKNRSFAKRTYNARTETANEKASFRNAWRRRQLCIVPADAIYEPNYESGKAVWWRIQRADDAPMALAGLWERRSWDDAAPEWSFTMLTVNADSHPLMRRFHRPGDEKRTVVVLDGDQIERWLHAEDAASIESLLKPCQPDLLVANAGRLKTEP